MATQSVSAGESWVNITTALTLTVAQAYLIQNKSPRISFIAEAASEPALSEGFRLEPNAFLSITPRTGMSHWVRSNVNTATLVVTESV